MHCDRGFLHAGDLLAQFEDTFFQFPELFASLYPYQCTDGNGFGKNTAYWNTL